MKEIELTQGKVAMVDDDMFDELNQHKWCALKFNKAFYVGRHSYGSDGKRKTAFMHHAIIGYPENGFEVDHCNCNGLDNQRSNLRFVTRRQNQQNRKYKYRSSIYPGVNWQKRDKKWQSRIWANGKRNHLGYFDSELEAFAAYKSAVESLGEKVIGDFQCHQAD